MSKLETALYNIHKGAITEKEANEASENLIKFFKILLEIQMGKPIFNT